MVEMRHNKKRNALLVYEFLVKTISRGIVEGDEKMSATALKVLKRFYRPGTELYKEFRIMRAIAKTTVRSERAASTILTEARKALSEIDAAIVDRQKSNLVSQINRTIGDPDFYDQEVPGYRDYASIQSMVNEWRHETPDIGRMGQHEDDVVKLLMTEKVDHDVEVDTEGLGTTRLVMKVMTRKLNEKYGTALTEHQRGIVRAYAYSTAVHSDDTLRMKLDNVRGELTTEIDKTLSSDVPGGDFVGRKLVEVRSIVSSDSSLGSDDAVMRHMTYAKLLNELRSSDVSIVTESTGHKLPPPAFTDPSLLTSYDVFEYSVDQVRESKERNAGKIILKGILQKADTLNQNGRIYPLAVLEREVRNYQKFISESRALGECVPPGTEIYTRDGWKRIEDIAEDEVIFTLNTESNETQLQRISRKVVLPYDGKMYRFRNHRSYDMCLTANHKMLMWDRNNKPYTLTAEEFYEKNSKRDSRVSHSSLRRAGGTWRGEEPEFFTQLSPKYPNIDTRLWAAFLGIYLADGCASGVNNPEMSKLKTIQITQKDPDVKACIEDLLSKLPFEYQATPRADGETFDYKIKCDVLHSHLLPLGNSRSKHVPLYTKGWTSEIQGIMLEWMLMGDGRHRKTGDGEIIPEYTTTSKKLAADVEEIMFKLGHGATIHVWDRSEDRPSPDPGRMILGENCADMNIVYQHSSKNIGLDMRFMKSEVFDYKGDVFCVTVPNGTWLMKYNGKVCWTHNCDHPDSSVVSLKNASHLIREAYIDDGVVYGTVEILHRVPSGAILAGLIESGVKLGISSRGVGSTKSKDGYQVVSDDFQLICWDFVSEPSTPGAFMIPEGKKLDGTRLAEELSVIFNKSDRIDRVLNEILYTGRV
jgi:hypothetical protein